MKNRFSAALILFLGIAGCASTPKQDIQVGDSKQEKLVDTYTALGKEYFQLGRYDIALENFNKALKTDPENSEAHRAIAILYEKMGRDDLVEFHLNQAISFGASNANAQNDYGKLLCSQGKYDEAESHFKQAIASPLYQRRWFALTNAGVCAFDANRMEDSERYLREALRIQPSYSPALLAMAKLKLQTNDLMRGRAFIQRYMSSIANPTPEALRLGLEIEQRLGDAEAARKYRARLENSYPDSEEAKSLSGLP